jgi:hypothetical protein
MPDLGPSDFHAEFQKQTLQIESVSNEVQPHRVVILIDASGSMEGGVVHRWAGAVMLADRIAEAKLPGISLALFIFGEKAEEKVDFVPNDNRSIVAALRQIESDPAYEADHVGGMTPLRDKIVESLKLFGTPRPGDAIFAITDGGDNASHSGSRNVASLLIQNKVRLFVCLISHYDMDAPTPEENYYEAMATAEDSGGLVVHGFNDLTLSDIADHRPARFNAAVESMLVAFIRQIVASRTVQIDLPAPINKPTNWKLSFADDKSSWAAGAKLLYPQRLAPCEQPKPSH